MGPDLDKIKQEVVAEVEKLVSGQLQEAVNKVVQDLTKHFDQKIDQVTQGLTGGSAGAGPLAGGLAQMDVLKNIGQIVETGLQAYLEFQRGNTAQLAGDPFAKIAATVTSMNSVMKGIYVEPFRDGQRAALDQIALMGKVRPEDRDSIGTLARDQAEALHLVNDPAAG